MKNPATVSFSIKSLLYCVLSTSLTQAIYSLTQQTDKSKRQIIVKCFLRSTIRHKRHSTGRNDSTSSRLHSYGQYQQERKHSSSLPRLKSYIAIGRLYKQARIFFFFREELRKLFRYNNI